MLDDDDTLAPGALKRLWSTWQAIPAAQRTTCLGIVGLCARENGQIVGDRFPHDAMDAMATDMFFVHGVHGEKFGCQRTDVLRQYPYPEDIPGFAPESLVWWAIAAQDWQIRFVNIVLRTSHQSTVSLSITPGDGSRHAIGLYLLNRSWIEQQWRYARYAPGTFLLAAARLTRFARGARRAGHGGVLQRYPVTHRPGRLAVALMAPLG